MKRSERPTFTFTPLGVFCPCFHVCVCASASINADFIGLTNTERWHFSDELHFRSWMSRVRGVAFLYCCVGVVSTVRGSSCLCGKYSRCSKKKKRKRKKEITAKSLFVCSRFSVTVAIQSNDDLPLYERFNISGLLQKQYNKVYTAEEFSQRLEIFSDNRRTINKHNEGNGSFASKSWTLCSVFDQESMQVLILHVMCVRSASEPVFRLDI